MCIGLYEFTGHQIFNYGISILKHSRCFDSMTYVYMYAHKNIFTIKLNMFLIFGLLFVINTHFKHLQVKVSSAGNLSNYCFNKIVLVLVIKFEYYFVLNNNILLCLFY